MPVQEVRDLGGQVVLRHLGDGKEKRGAGHGGAWRGGGQRAAAALVGCAPARRMRGPASRGQSGGGGGGGGRLRGGLWVAA